jgi:hypothetical protein
MAYQIASLIGAALVLAAYVAYQRGIMGRESRWYNLMNTVGAALLTWVALADRRWGFVLLEGSWTILSLIPLLRPPHAES